MSARPAELRALTGARGIAAWLVVLYHVRLSIAGLPASVVAVLAKGYLAVDFFFLLSGFVIWLSWHERLHAGDGRQKLEFLCRRVARIWPLHLLLLCGAVLLALGLSATGWPDVGDYPYAQLPLQVLLVQNWGFAELAWNVPAWSISTEVAAYLLFALLAGGPDWTRWSRPALLIVAGALLATLYLTMPKGGSLGADIAHYGLVRCLAEFGTGTVVAALWKRAPERSWRRPASLAIALAVLRALGVPETLIVPTILAAALLAIVRSAGCWGNPLERRAIHYLGEISFATYLSHTLLWRAFKMAVVTDPLAVPAPLIALYLGIVLLASVALYELVERPAQRRLQRLPLAWPRGAGRAVGRPAPHR